MTPKTCMLDEHSIANKAKISLRINLKHGRHKDIVLTTMIIQKNMLCSI
ncbi:hypothetical protein OF001_U20091 [Pseudomonas sp. OF001]|nr:hypothetical protein OF001_U20091 [Pseudomonas sp. OF001]